MRTSTLRLLIAALLTALLPPSVAAQLRGGVTQNQAPDTSALHIGQLLADMSHDISVVSVKRNPSMEAQFNADVAEFDAITKQNVTQTSPCVDQYRRAFSQATREADLRQQNASVQAINQAHALWTATLVAANACETSGRSGSANGKGTAAPPPSTTSPDPVGPPIFVPTPGPSARRGSRGTTPAGRNSSGTSGPPLTGGATSANGVVCPGGVRVPRASYTWEVAQRLRTYACRTELATGDFICCPGTYWTGYEGPIPTPEQIRDPNRNGSPCANPTPPPECRPTPVPPRGSSAPPPITPKPMADTLAYMRGIAQGLADCARLPEQLIKVGQDLLGAAAAMARGDFVTAADLLGLAPGESIVLRGIYQEATTQNIGISPYQAGLLAGRRICTYVIVPGVQKMAGRVRLRPTGRVGARPPAGAGAVTPGTTPGNPLTGAAIAEAAAADATLSATGSVLPGKFIATAKGPLPVGTMRGAGKFGTVYEVPSQPRKLLKVANTGSTSAASFPRQVAGSKLLQRMQPPIPTPALDTTFAQPGRPPILVVDNVTTKFPGARLLPPVGPLTPAQVQCVRQLYQRLSDAGLVWVDGHPANIFTIQGPNGLEAGVLDADMIFPAADALLQDKVSESLAGVLQSISKGGALFPPNGPAIMQALFDWRYGPLGR